MLASLTPHRCVFGERRLCFLFEEVLGAAVEGAGEAAKTGPKLTESTKTPNVLNDAVGGVLDQSVGKAGQDMDQLGGKMQGAMNFAKSMASEVAPSPVELLNAAPNTAPDANATFDMLHIDDAMSGSALSDVASSAVSSPVNTLMSLTPGGDAGAKQKAV